MKAFFKMGYNTVMANLLMKMEMNLNLNFLMGKHQENKFKN